MNRQQIGLGLILRELGITLNMKTFANRLILQKTILILQNAGVFLGYRFGWYIKGPYSPDLANDLFYIYYLPDKGERDLQNWELDEHSQTTISRLKNLLNNNKLLKDRARHLELLASILFLLYTRQAQPAEKEKILEILKINKKQFTIQNVNSAFEELKNYEFSV
jgi:uncharacterized protein YwgA